MASDFQTAFEVLRGSVTEGRAENMRYRQNELYSLHLVLRENAEPICEAITKDHAGPTVKAETEFFLAMDAVRISYERLDFDKSMAEEYFVKFGKDNRERRAALGLVAIRPSRHNRFYSVITPLVAALQAGNCVIVELGRSSPAVDGVLLDILPKALDRDTFHITTDKIGEQYKDQINLLVDQDTSEVSSPAKGLQSPPQGRTVCFLDRTGDVEFAAKTITSSRTLPDFSSPYSPDLVLVNEYLKENFIARCLDFATQVEPSCSSKAASSDDLEFQKILKQTEARGEVAIHKRNNDFSIIELKIRSSKFTTLKVKGPYILLLPTTGIVDSVTLQRSFPILLSSYIFASPSASKFIAEQIPSHATYINQVPPQLLIGPPSPTNHPHALHPRFTSDMFSTPRPQFITPPPTLPAPSKLMEIALKQLKPTGQRPGHAIGFFEQGILLGLTSTALVVLPLLGWGAFKAVKVGLRYL